MLKYQLDFIFSLSNCDRLRSDNPHDDSRTVVNNSIWILWMCWWFIILQPIFRKNHNFSGKYYEILSNSTSKTSLLCLWWRWRWRMERKTEFTFVSRKQFRGWGIRLEAECVLGNALFTNHVSNGDSGLSRHVSLNGGLDLCWVPLLCFCIICYNWVRRLRCTSKSFLWDSRVSLSDWCFYGNGSGVLLYLLPPQRDLNCD